MRLLTDYPQWYDSIFDDQPPPFERFAFKRGGLTKTAQFRLFQSLGLKTPPFGSVERLAQELDGPIAGAQPPQLLSSELKCVVYLDELGHAGSGKALLNLHEARSQHPQVNASLFVPTVPPALVIRLVRFGQWAFWIRQQGSPTDWRSNLNDTETVLDKHRCREPNPIPRALWAIDFLPTQLGLLAIDFNTAPQLVTLGENGWLSPSEVRAELTEVAARAPDQLKQF
jgi:hypothetical protein